MRLAIVLTTLLATTTFAIDTRELPFAGKWQTHISPAKKTSALTVNIVEDNQTIEGSIVFGNPDGSEIETPILNAKVSGSVLEFETIVNAERLYWTLTLKKVGGSHGLLHGRFHETLINEAVARQREVCTGRDSEISGIGRQADQCSLKAWETNQSYPQEPASKAITNQVIADYVNRIAQNLERNSVKQVQVTIKLIDTDEINAFTFPGGLILVSSGLILVADNEAELAAVISHEIAHARSCPSRQEMISDQLTNVGSRPLIFRLLGRQFTRNTIYLTPYVSLESEADFIGIEYLYKAGYDPHAAISMLEKVTAIEEQTSANGANAFVLKERIKKARHSIDKLSPPASEYKKDTSEFKKIKAMVYQQNKGRTIKPGTVEAMSYVEDKPGHR